uniref:AlNc14C378G11190 protein n=1 Tax=Albugo laibachii Nc14 TaxID=890382 RepID=F0WYD0_9STRA|nr:AlNc14C378G11190 [Albugo laibachii Nc14]|eukprot:CCA26483.1 AlNc14C378G11190 [Albugo laibachii Nc14]
MRPTDRIADAAKPAAPADLIDSSERATDRIHEEKSEVPEVALVKVLAMLEDFPVRMCRMESSQSGKERQHRKDSTESSVFDSVLGVGAMMILQALKCKPSPKRSLNLLPATSFGARRLAQIAGNYKLGPAELGVSWAASAGLSIPRQGYTKSWVFTPRASN